MGSPIDTWEGATVIYSGAGGATPWIFLVAAVGLVVAAIVLGMIKEEVSYSKHK